MFGNCEDVSKVLLIALNVAVGLLSIVLVALGIWALTSDYGANEISALITTDLFTAACVLVIVGGVVLFLLAFLGGLAALLDSRILLITYCTIMMVFLLAVIIGTIVGFFFLDEIEDELADNMSETLTTQYGVNLTKGNNEAVTEVWNNVQRDLKCCGVRGSLNSTESWYLWQSSFWFRVEGIGLHADDITKWWFVPTSCCNTDFTFDTCQDYNAANSQPPKQDLDEVVVENPALYHSGCLDKLKDKIREHIIAITVAAALLLVVLIICLFLAIFMVCSGAGQQAKVV